LSLQQHWLASHVTERSDVLLDINDVDVLIKRKAEVASCDDDAIRLLDDLVDIGESVDALDLGVDTHMLASDTIKDLSCLLDVLT